MTPTVSVLICTRNRCSALATTLETLKYALENSPHSCEVIIADNNSEDSTPGLISGWLPQLPSARLIKVDAIGLSNARNAALAAARGKVILFTDDDVAVPTNWVEGMAKPILSGEAHAVAGGIRLAAGLERDWMTPLLRLFLADTSLMHDSTSAADLFGANMAFSHEVLQKVPQFDPNLGAGRLGFGEETLFSLQLREAGYHIVQNPECSVVHNPDPSRLIRKSWQQSFLARGRTNAYLRYHWQHVRTPRLLLAWYALAWLKHFFLMRYSGTVEREGVHPRDYSVMTNLGFYSQWIIESKKERRYEKHGLRPLTML